VTLPAITVCGSLSRFPVSLGRAMHLAGYEALSLPFTYVPFACRDLPSAIAGVRGLSIRGVGVSMPFKVDVLPLLDAVEPAAARIGAVNTIVNDEGHLTGHNTDAIGARRALEEVTSLSGKRTLLLGAGGAARAVAVAMQEAGVALTIANRNAEKASELAATVGARAASLDEVGDLSRYDIVVNASSAGMLDVDPGSPVPASSLRPGVVVMDIVYKPLETELVRVARERGATTISGERMLLHQAMEQFRLYTGHAPPREAMERALLQAIGPVTGS
jgi:shikimate dehydrogenase